MPNRQPPRRALVTGASSGIGAGLAKRLAARGIEVWIAARRLPQLEALAKEISDAGGKAHPLQLDVSHADSTYERLVTLDAETGGLDLVVANAGLGGEQGGRSLAATSWSDLRELVNVNLLGAAATIHAFIGPMLARGNGHLVGVSSIAADLPLPLGAAYGTSKAAFTFLLESADIELRPQGVAVTIVHPGFVRTPMLESLSKEKMPLEVGLDDAVGLIDRGIRRRDRMIRFPWVTGALARSTRMLPRGLTDAAVRATTRRQMKR